MKAVRSGHHNITRPVLALFGLIALASPARAETIALVCETSSLFPECDASFSNGRCLNGPRSLVLKVDFGAGRVEFADQRNSVNWVATGAKVSDDSVEWDQRAPWPKNPALQSRWSGTLNRLTGEVDIDYRYDGGPGSTWHPRGLTGKCRRATQKF